MIQGLTHFSALKMKLLEAGKVLRLAGETKCPVYPGKSSYVGVLTLQSLLFYPTLPANPALLFAMDPSSSAHNAPRPQCRSSAVDPRAGEQRQV